MSIPQIVTLQEVCLKNTSYLFLDKYFEQVHGVAMGSPISPLYCQPVQGRVQSQGHKFCPTPSPLMAQAYGWHLCHSTGKTVTSSSSTSTPKTFICSLLLRTLRKMVSYPFWTLSILGFKQHPYKHSLSKAIHMDKYLHSDSNYFLAAKHSV